MAFEIQYSRKRSKYKQYRNKLSPFLRISEKIYYATCIENNKQKLYQVINSVIDKNKMTLVNNRFKYSGNILTNKKDIANRNIFGPKLAQT